MFNCDAGVRGFVSVVSAMKCNGIEAFQSRTSIPLRFIAATEIGSLRDELREPGCEHPGYALAHSLCART
jgi:hypothetical protein